MAKKTYEQSLGILGCTKESTPEEIKKAYRKLAIQYHPDKNLDGNPDFDAKFKEIAEAYMIVNKVKDGTADFTGFEFNEEDFNFAKPIKDLLQKEFGDVFSDLYSAKFVQGKHQIRFSKVNKDIKLNIREYKDGCQKDVNIQRLVQCECYHKRDKCKSCNGDSYKLIKTTTILGTVKLRQTCLDCSGTGLEISEQCDVCGDSLFVLEESSVRVDILPYSERVPIVKAGLGNWDFSRKKYDDLEFYPVLDEIFITETSFGDLELRLDMEYDHLLTGGSVLLDLHSGKTDFDLEQYIKMGKKISISGAGLKKDSKLDIVIGLAYPGEYHYPYTLDNAKLSLPYDKTSLARDL